MYVVYDEQAARDNDDDNAGDRPCDDSAGNTGARGNDDKDDYDASDDVERQMPWLIKTAGRLKKILFSYLYRLNFYYLFSL